MMAFGIASFSSIELSIMAIRMAFRMMTLGIASFSILVTIRMTLSMSKDARQLKPYNRCCILRWCKCLIGHSNNIFSFKKNLVLIFAFNTTMAKHIKLFCCNSPQGIVS
jgi:hypothetical protein